MKIALICPSNLLFMPYVESYINVLKEIDVAYHIINWDRFGIEKHSEFVYRDSKVGHQRGGLDYIKYSRFIVKILNKEKYDKIIVFGIQLVFFLKERLIKRYQNDYVVDIRDNNKAINFFNIGRVIRNSAITVLSSPGYKEWLPKSDKYIIQHNTMIHNQDELRNASSYFKEGKKISIGYIGALRDLKINIDLIESLKHNQFIQLNYHGEGDISNDISQYVFENDIKNVILTGRFERNEENALYYENDFINVLRYNDSINNKTALPNRLYNSVKFCKPMLAFEGTQLAEIIKNYDLGLVIKSFQNLEDLIRKYINEFDSYKYEKGRISFLEKILKENNEFSVNIKNFVLASNSTLSCERKKNFF